MSIKAVLGCLYGDEGKAKIIDVLASEMDVIVRFQGGSNAGHTIQFENQKFILHLIPSGIFHKNQICILAAGVVIDPFQLEIEIQSLLEKSFQIEDRFFIDERATIVLPIHKELDAINESLSEAKKIGTTKRGIGPAYADSVSRIAIKIYDLQNKDILKDKIEFIYKFHQIELPFDNLMYQVDGLYNFGQKYKNCFINLPYKIDTLIKENKKILFEGAQGSLLDVYFGTYPFVTSSHTIAGGIAASVGFSPKKIDEIIGVYKSYFTRVGEGPFPTELFDDIGKRIQKQGHEFGSTTGRPRRCGWFDAVAARYTTMINGIDSIALTLLDVLSGIETLKICVGYETNDKLHITNHKSDKELQVTSFKLQDAPPLPPFLIDNGQWIMDNYPSSIINYQLNKGGQIVSDFPSDSSILYNVKPVYLEMPGWTEDITKCKSYDELPSNAKAYVKKIEELLLVPVKIISVGPFREQTIFR